MKSNNLTNVRTFLQFSQYGYIKQIEFNGNKLMAINTIRSMFGVKQFSILSERITDNFLPIGNYTILN